MPELPEVETIRRGLRPKIVGRRVESVWLRKCRIFHFKPEQFEETVRGQQIQALRRRGKYLNCFLERHCLILHFGMTGQLTFRDPSRRDSAGFIRHPITGLEKTRQHPPDKHTHLVLTFSDQTSLLFRDIRKFGHCYLLSRSRKSLQEFFSRLGLEPIGPGYRLDRFLDGFEGRKLAVKSLLLDQSVVAGVGNIYADEALFEARIHPQRACNSLTKGERERLFHAIRRVLRKGIRFGGTSLRDYVNGDGEPGWNQEELLVYGRDGSECRTCGALIEKIRVGQRGTHYCPHCQEPPRGYLP